jgi:hypothetical protein
VISNKKIPDNFTRGAILICSEGKTEKLYFDIIVRAFDVNVVTNIKILGNVGQLEKLIDNCENKRVELAQRLELKIDEIETWAVCDDDKRTPVYRDLVEYARKRNIHLAYSRPQFESYLLQHFEQSKETKRSIILHNLKKYVNQGKHFSDYKKGNLDWLECAISANREIVETAIINSNQRINHTSNPFFSVQNLTARLLDLGL